MHSSEPTVPNRGSHEPGAATGRTGPGAFAEAPTWPPESERPSRTIGPARPAAGTANATLLRVSLGANVVLVVLLGLLGVLVLSHAGPFAAGGSSGAARGSPTATASPDPLSGWLQVAPSTVQLGCDAGQRAQVVVLTNTGPQRVHWQVVLDGSASPAGIAIDPDQGDIEAGASLSVQLQNTTRASGPRRVSGQQGVIRFAPTAAEAGASPSLSYTTVGCH
jgi:hypothetical protein